MSKRRRRPTEASCVVCGCTDSHGCPEGCAWLFVDRALGKGLCLSCARAAFHAVEALELHRGTSGDCVGCDRYADDYFQAKHKKICPLGLYVLAAAKDAVF